MPVFLSRTEIADTWRAVQRQRGAATPAPLPASLTLVDLRILVRRMQAPISPYISLYLPISPYISPISPYARAPDAGEI